MNQVSDFLCFFYKLVVRFRVLSRFSLGFDGLLFGLNGVLGPLRQGRQAECASFGKTFTTFIFLVMFLAWVTRD
jgi:hypothetical protein